VNGLLSKIFFIFYRHFFFVFTARQKIFPPATLKLCTHVQRKPSGKLEPKVRDEISFLQEGKEKDLLTGLNELYLFMQLTD
jgi:hypothetical protein